MMATCDCYPGGFSPDTYEGPQEHCPIHGRKHRGVPVDGRTEARCVCPTDDYCPRCHPKWYAASKSGGKHRAEPVWHAHANRVESEATS